MKETNIGTDQQQGWIDMCDRLNTLLDEAHASLAKIIGPTVTKEDSENKAGAGVASSLDHRLSEAIYSARSLGSRINELVNRF